MKPAPTILRQGLAELLGTFMLVLLGDGAVAEYKMRVAISDVPDVLSVAFGYGFALMVGILVASW